MQCTNQLKQLGLALHNHHDTYETFPGGTYQFQFKNHTIAGDANSDASWPGAAKQWSYLTVLMPFMEQQNLYDEFITTAVNAGKTPWSTDVGVLTRPIPFIVCPSETNTVTQSGLTPTSYRCNRGDQWISWNRPECRGPFCKQYLNRRGFRDLVDGSSNTMFVSEIRLGTWKSNLVSTGIATNVGASEGSPPSLCTARRGANNMLLGDYYNSGTAYTNGSRWACGQTIYTQWIPILAPNSPTCANFDPENLALPTASSYHPGGVNVLFGDGSVKFMPDTIDAGDPTQAPSSTTYSGPSYYGVWGALGSTSGSEVVELP